MISSYTYNDLGHLLDFCFHPDPKLLDHRPYLTIVVKIYQFVHFYPKQFVNYFVFKKLKLC